MAALLVLDDDRERTSGYAAVLPQLGADWTLETWSDPAGMVAELDGLLSGARFIALEASIASPVVHHLASRNPTCPVTLHWKHSTHEAAWNLFKQLRARGWNVDLVFRFREHYAEWHPGQWLPEARTLLQWPGDTRANGAHAANCALLRSQFEGREAIYIEKYVRRVRVSHIRAHVDWRHVQAYAEEILTPGLGAPAREAAQSRWRFAGGKDVRFSPNSWSLAVQHVSWQLCFAPAVIKAVVDFAATIPADEVYRSTALQKLIWQLTENSVHQEEPVFPG
jgi:hypothetical protein